MKKKFFLILMIAVFTTTLFVTARFYVGGDEGLESYQGDVVVFSLDKLNYDAAQTLTLSIAEESGLAGEIRYTTDGSEPTIDSEIYTAPIELSIIEGRECHTIRAALFHGEEQSRIYTRSYFIGSEAVLDENEYVVSITAAPDDFYGIMGIFYGPEEITDDEYYNHLNEIIVNYLQRGRDWERRANIEIYSSNGEMQLSQIAGVRIAGNYTRRYLLKSLRLYARGEYDAAYPKFDCGFLDQGIQPNGLEKVEFNQIDLRSGANNWTTMLNDTYGRRVALDAGMDPIADPRPAAVYLNGEFYGFMWLTPSYCEKNIEEMLSLPDSENVQIINGSEWAVSGDDDATQDFSEMYNFILDNDFTVEANARKLEELVDMDNLFMYYVLEMHLRNADWIVNNFRMYRYVGEPIPDNKYTDGRWRFIFYDLDYILWHHEYSTYEMDIFEWMFDRGISRSFGILMENPGFRSRFINIWCDLMSTALKPENAIAIFDQTILQTAAELEYLEQTQPDIYSETERLALYEYGRDFIADREQYVRESMAAYFDAQGLYSLEVENSDSNAEILMNAGFVTLAYGQSLSGSYYTNNACVVNANYEVGYEFDYWLVNGEKVENETLVLGDDIVGGEKSVSVTLVTKRVEKAEPVMTRISYKGADDWIEIKNPGTAPIDLSAYYLSDKVDNPYKYTIPAIMLEAGESVVIYSNYNVYAPLGGYQFGFKLAQYETVVLTGQNGTLEEVHLPNSKEGYIYQRRPYSRGWHYEAGGRYNG